jgi:hypothetical protein
MVSIFYFNNGMQCQDIPGLITALESIDDETFRFHRNSKKNDFYNWVNEGLGMHDMAAVVKKSRTRKGMIRNLRKSA